MLPYILHKMFPVVQKYLKKNLNNCIENVLVTVMSRENKMLFNKIKADLLRI